MSLSRTSCVDLKEVGSIFNKYTNPWLIRGLCLTLLEASLLFLMNRRDKNEKTQQVCIARIKGFKASRCKGYKKCKKK
jgi:hypothetical protein